MNTILFDLDGTLLSMDLDEFISHYFGLVVSRFKDSQYDEKKIIKSILAGTEAMQKNDGTKRNEEVFWDVFQETTGIERQEIEGDFEAFYKNDFQEIEKAVSQNKAMIEAVDILKEKGYRLICATNPLFPDIASASRLKWSGVDTSAFDFVTTYEDFSYAKPNVEYFKEVLTKYDVDQERCIMVGNDSLEDGIIETINVPVYLIDDHLIHRDDTPVKSTWLGNSTAFLELVKDLPNIKTKQKK